jgi:APA family basic amino acid/polyamine antiporter
MGWAYWGGYLIASGYVTLGFGGYLEQLSGLPRVPAAVGLVIVLALLNLRGVRVSSRFQTLLVAFEVTALFVIAGVGSMHARPALLTPFMPQGWSGVIAASLVAFLAFGGFDQVAAMGDEVHEPRRTLPCAILTSLLLVLILYLGLLYAALGSVPWQELSASTAPLALAAQEFLGGGVSVAVPLLALVATTATANALVLVTSRVLFAMAADGQVPTVLGRVAGRQQVPILAILVSVAGMILVAASGDLSLVVDATGFLYAGGFILTLAAYFRLRQRGTGSGSAFTVPAYPWVPLAALALTSVVLLQARSGALVGIFWLALGGAVHVLMWLSQRGRKRSAA